MSDKTKWATAGIRCLACGHIWVAVWPFEEGHDPDEDRIECPVCHEQTGMPTPEDELVRLRCLSDG